MKRNELEHIIRASADIADDDEIIVVESQSILGQFPNPPHELLVSVEADVYPKNHPERWELIDGSIGELFKWLALMLLMATSCRPAPSDSLIADASALDGAGSEGGASGHIGSPSGEGFWLRQIGTGEVQTRKVCDRGASDPVVRALCATLDTPIRSLRELYARVGLPAGDKSHGQIALASQSSGRTFQAVSQLNPRLVTTTLNEYRAETISLHNLAVTAFSRGEQAVELAAHDPSTGTLNTHLMLCRLPVPVRCPKTRESSCAPGSWRNKSCSSAQWVPPGGFVFRTAAG